MGQNGSSILAVDFGSVHTRAMLIDLVDGAHKLVARAETRTTDGFPVNDIAVGFDRVLRQLSAVTDRRFMAESGQIITPEQRDRSGVDFFALTASIGRPLRAVLVGLTPEVSVASALRATEGTYIDIAATISLDDERNEEERLNAILLNTPDMIVISGGTEDGAQDTVLSLANVVQLALRLMDERHRPTVIFTGNSALQEAIVTMFDGLTDVLLAQNVRPALEMENLEAARIQLGRAYDRYKENRNESFAIISPMSQTGVLPSAQSYDIIAEYLGKITKGGVALVDVGSAASVLALAQADGGVRTSIRTDLGLGHSAPLLLESVGADAVRRWLPFITGRNILKNYVLNKSLRPATIPASLADLYLEHGLLKAAVNAMLEGIDDERAGPQPLSLVISAGAALTNTGNPGHDALLLLDALQPAGVTILKSDPFGLVVGMGAIAVHNPEATVQLMDGDNLIQLGTAISLSGVPRLDRPAMRIRITLDDGQVIKHTLDGGNLWVYPLPVGRSAKIRVRSLSGTSVNGKRSVKLTVSGGTAGLIFDARGRPIPLLTDVRARAEQLAKWMAQATGGPVRMIDEGLMEEMATEADTAVAEEVLSEKKSRRRKAREDQPKADDTEKSDDKAKDELDELRNVLS